MFFSELFAVAATTALTAVNPRKLKKKQRKWYQAGQAGATVLTLNAGYSQLKEPDITGLQRLGTNAAMAGLAWWATSGKLDHIDEAIETWLSNRGARYPRYWMAAADGALVAFTFACNRYSARKSHGIIGPLGFGVPVRYEKVDLATTELDDKVRAIIETLILEDEPQFETINEQLDVAEMYTADSGECQYIGLHIPEDAEVDRIVPHTQTWPVHGQFSFNGTPVSIHLDISNGRLSGLWMDLESEDIDLPTEDFPPLKDWPHPNQLTIISDTTAS